MMEFIIDKTTLMKYSGNRETVIVPNGITHIAPNAFMNCVHIQNIILPDTLTSIGHRAFYNCKSLIDISIPETVTEIGTFAFYKCKSLTSICLPKNLSRIGAGLFQSCENLISITVGEKIQVVEPYSFFDTPFLDNQSGIIRLGKYIMLGYLGGEKVLRIPEGIRVIADEITCYKSDYVPSTDFEKAYVPKLSSDFEKIYFPNSLEHIGAGSFSMDTLRSIDLGTGVKSIGQYAFQDSGIEEVIGGKSVERIDEDAFEGTPFL